MDTKSKSIIVVFVLLAGTLQSFPAKSGQEWRVGYLRYVQNPVSTENVYRVQSMIADYNNGVVSFYGEKCYQWDSLEVIALDKKGNIINDRAYSELVNVHGVGSRDFVVADLKTGYYTQYYQEVLCYFIGHGTLSMPEWSYEEESRIILGRLCSKATANFLGRQWIVWFDPEVPLSFGPWLLWGVPGLIIEAEDAKKEIRFVYHYMEPLADDHRREFLESFYLDSHARHRFDGDVKECEKLYTKFKRDEEFSNRMHGIIGGYVVDKDGKRVKPEKKYYYVPMIPDSYWDEK